MKTPHPVSPNTRRHLEEPEKRRNTPKRHGVVPSDPEIERAGSEKNEEKSAILV